MQPSTSIKFIPSFKFALLALLGAVFLSGCGSGPQPVNQAYVQEATDRSSLAHDIFTSSKGDLSKVDSEDHAKLVKLFGSQSEVERIWNNMAHPMAGGQGADRQAPKK